MTPNEVAGAESGAITGLHRKLKNVSVVDPPDTPGL